MPPCGVRCSSGTWFNFADFNALHVPRGSAFCSCLPSLLRPSRHLKMVQYSMFNGTVQFRHEGENTTRTTTVPVSPYRARAPGPPDAYTWGLSDESIELIFLLMVLIDVSAVYVKFRWRQYTCEATEELEDLE
ncbi:hypothetical protein FOMPIDRAFT_1055272 [Fomitopsis schrenkii]|uniref:Uncharacterized protein n=1 Tax=Fomitopsis schrenkii TaxID=2126942 RepID=S8DNR5_FOMSC|nr:hypothetical protein FOMPIDRAFT_1055272 [Fomitopsis schrenkii]